MAAYLVNSLVTAEKLLADVRRRVEYLMSGDPFDPSHDWNHILRVVAFTKLLLDAERTNNPTVEYDPFLVELVAVLHEIGDHKYPVYETSRRPILMKAAMAIEGPPTPEDSEERPITAEIILLSYGAPQELADLVQTLILNVGCSRETANPEVVARLIAKHPELAIVQDADRLEAVGAYGLGRLFTFGGARRRVLEDSRKKIHDVALLREKMMKTQRGKELAAERCDFLRAAIEAWDREVDMLAPWMCEVTDK